MTSIKKTNALFKKALRDDQLTAVEAKKIAKTLKKGGVSAVEKRAVGAQIQKNGDSFSSKAEQILSKLVGKPAPTERGGGSDKATGSSAQAATAASAPSARGRDVADEAIRAIGDLKEPQIPGADATPQQLAQYEKDTKRYDRMMELMSNVIKKRDELQMSIIRKM